MNAEGLQQELKERLGDVALVAKQFAKQVFNQCWYRFAIIDVAWRERHTQQFTSIVDDQVQLETEEPAGRALSSLARSANTLC